MLRNPASIYAIQRFARMLRQDFDAVKHAVAQTWNNNPTGALPP